MEDQDIQVMSQKNPNQVMVSSQRVITEYSLYLNGAITDASDYAEHFAVYKTATQDDMIFLYINSLGGSVSVGQQIIKHMRDCEAPIIGVIGMDCASQAAAIAMACDDLEFDEMSTMLIHQFSYGAASTANQVYAQAAFNKELNAKWINQFFSELLTEEEMERVMGGQDILLHSEELEARWAEIVENRQKITISE